MKSSKKEANGRRFDEIEMLLGVLSLIENRKYTTTVSNRQL